MSSTLSMVNKEHVMTKLKRRRFPFKKLTSIVEYIFLLSLSFFRFLLLQNRRKSRPTVQAVSIYTSVLFNMNSWKDSKRKTMTSRRALEAFNRKPSRQ